MERTLHSRRPLRRDRSFYLSVKILVILNPTGYMLMYICPILLLYSFEVYYSIKSSKMMGWGRPTPTLVPWRQGFRLQQGRSVGASLSKPKWSGILLKFPASTGYFSNSSGASVTKRRFSLVHRIRVFQFCSLWSSFQFVTRFLAFIPAGWSKNTVEDEVCCSVPLCNGLV
jgi:hypothetical protein